LVKEEKDLYRVPVLTSLGFIVVGLWSLIIIKREFGVSFCYQKTETLTSYLTGGKNIFIASLSGNLYGQGSTIILGLFVTPAIVGYYSLAQKLSSALVSVFQVLSQTLMPYFSKVKQEDEHIFFLIVKKFFWVVFFASTLLFGITALLSDYIYNLVSGFDSSIGYYAFSFWLIIGVLTVFNVYFNIVIVALNQDKFMAQFYMFVGLSFICYGTLLTLLYSYQGMLISMLIVEMLILFFSLVAIKRGAMPVVKVSK
jgi:PST family polysaccharide transporter